MPQGSTCPRCAPPATGNPRRGSGGKRATFRRRTLAKTGGRCGVVGCRTPFDRVQADHVDPLADGGDPDGPGFPRCFTHHLLKTRQEAAARRERAALRIGRGIA